MKRLARSFAALLLLLTLGFGVAVPVSVSAYCNNNGNPLVCACGAGGGVEASSSCAPDGKTDPIGGPNGVLKKVSLVIAFLAGVAAVIVILIAGFMYVTAGGDAQKTATARNAILGAAIGLVIIAASESILLFVLSKV